jgi:hypothetical protein
LIVNVNTKINRDISPLGDYTFNRAFSNTDGISTFPANPSPLFGQANQSTGANSPGGTTFLESANNYRLEMQARFTF